jgi:hypothetical protein
MTEEEKITAEADANHQEDEKLEKENGSSQEDKTDYQALLLAERERADRAEKALAEKRFKNSQSKRKEEDEIEDEIDEDEKPVTKKQFQELLARERQATQKEFQEKMALDIARANTSSEEEAQASLLFWKNRVIPTGNLEDDIKFAIGGLNQKKIVARNAELSRALKSKSTKNDTFVDGQQDGMPKTEPKLSANSPLKDWKYAGNGVYSKKLSSGKTMFKNTKAVPGSPKIWVE